MKKALFVDHSFHKNTRSSDFFIDIVRRGYEVEVYYLTPEDPLDMGVVAAAEGADCILLWQMDFLAPFFLAIGKPTIVIPMFDGSGGMPDLHWHFARKARFCNFSLLLNERIRISGAETLLLRYFPEPAPEPELAKFDKLSAFFWQRRPDHGIDFSLIDKLIGSELDHFHVHNAPDILGDFRINVPETAPYQFTESAWFKNRADYEERLAQANVFVAPRLAEGIGMAMLEAMARGMLVLAHDAPTNNEYISNWVNGILFNRNLNSGVQIRGDAARLGRMAWKTVVDGRRQWLDSQPAILEWIEGAVSIPPISIDRATFITDLWQSYYASLAEYEGFLRRHIGLLGALCELPFLKVIELAGQKVDGDALPEPASAGFHSLRNGVLDVTDTTNRYIGSGWHDSEGEWRWAQGTSSTLQFTGLKTGSDKVEARFEASSLPELGRRIRCTLTLNGTVVFDSKITPGWKMYSFAFHASLLKAENDLHFSFEKARSIPSDSRVLSARFKQITFSS